MKLSGSIIYKSMFTFYLKSIFLSITQSILNIFLYFFIKFNKRFKEILKIKKNFEHLNYSKKQNKEKKSVVVFEMFNLNESIFTFFVWSMFFKNKLKRKCYCYPVKIDSIYNPLSYYIYKNLGFSFINYNLNYNQKLKVEMELKKINFNKLNKIKLLNLKIRKVPVGDLIYDHYLRYFKVPTINIESKKIFELIKNAASILIFWEDYFKKNEVSSFFFSHSPYLLGLPGRVAAFNNVDSINIAGNSTYRYNKNTIYMGDQFKKGNQILKNFFKKIGPKKKKKIIKKYKNYLKEIFSGKKESYGMLPYSQKDTFKKIKKYKKRINNSKKFKILIATHDFYEGPNLWGKFNFPDFFEWLTYLNNYIKKNKIANREWFIKPHPDATENYKEQLNIMEEIFKDNNKVKILPPKTTHTKILDKNINFVLSARGSIGYQYAYLGIHSLYCSDIGLYKSFGFNFRSKNLKDYKNKLDKMEIISKKKINYSSILKFVILLDLFVYKHKNEFILPNNYKIQKKKRFLYEQTEIYTTETFKDIVEHLDKKKNR